MQLGNQCNSQNRCRLKSTTIGRNQKYVLTVNCELKPRDSLLTAWVSGTTFEFLQITIDDEHTLNLQTLPTEQYTRDNVPLED